MNHEKPNNNKCNRVCLVFLAVIKIIANILGIAVYGYIREEVLIHDRTPSIIIISRILLIDIGLVLDTAFMIVIIVGACKKCKHITKLSSKYLKISFIMAVVLSFMFIFLIFVPDIYKYYTRDHYRPHCRFPENLLLNIAIISPYSLIHILMLLLINSEMTKTTTIEIVHDCQQSVVDSKAKGTTQKNGYLV